MNAAAKLSRDDLMSLEQYSEERAAIRERVIRHKALRRIALGPHATLIFEDRVTISYQIQEMLRVERIFDAAGIEEELEAYNPLIPDGSNWKATFLIEYPDPTERAAQLAKMVGIEHQVWVQIGDGARITAIANEDLERSTDEKTAAVHFLRFELSEQDVAALKSGAELVMGIEHPALAYESKVDAESRDSLIADLTG